MRIIHKIITTVFGAGYSPIAPGTAGALVGVIMLWGYQVQFPETSYFGWKLMIITTLITLLGVFSTDALTSEWGKDPSKVVVDELVGVWISLIFVPITWHTLLAGFVLFRFFDIAKPLGIRKLEKIEGGWGVMLDDVAAGIYANIVLQIILIFW